MAHARFRRTSLLFPCPELLTKLRNLLDNIPVNSPGLTDIGRPRTRVVKHRPGLRVLFRLMISLRKLDNAALSLQ
jgi:hypothetical protein